MALIYQICPKCDGGPMDLQFWCTGSGCSHSGDMLHIKCSACSYGTTCPCADAEPIELEGVAVEFEGSGTVVNITGIMSEEDVIGIVRGELKRHDARLARRLQGHNW